MVPDESWLKCWGLGVFPSRESEISQQLLNRFRLFWKWSRVSEKSKSTQKRFSNSLQALGGWMVNKAVSNEDISSAELDEFMLEATALGEGPLIFPENETWQRELDSVCRKLHEFLLLHRASNQW